MKLSIGMLSRILHNGHAVVAMLLGTNAQDTIGKLKQLAEDPAAVQRLQNSLHLLKIYLDQLHNAEIE